jgi:ethanolamine utilization protein EutQ (cupin superfamily)
MTALTVGGTMTATKLVPTGNVTAGNGMYLPTTNQIAIGTNGAERVRINASGNVGIGTSAPIDTLHVYSASTLDHIFVDGTAGINRNVGFGTDGSRRWNIYANSSAESGSNVGSDLSIARYSDAGTFISADFIIKRDTGNVGIGTTSPSAKLDVSASLLGTRLRNNTNKAFSTFNAINSSADAYNQINNAQLILTSNNNAMSFLVGGAFNNRVGGIQVGHNEPSESAAIGTLVLNPFGGNVGIGTTSPARILDVNGDAAIHGVRVGRGAGDIGSNTALGSGALNANTTGSFNTANGFNALQNNTTGGFNTANGFNALQNNTTGGSNTANGLNAGIGVSPFANANTTGSNNTFIGFASVGASATASNVITLGNSSIATLRCQVTTITSLSDERDKKNIAPLNAGLDFLTKLRPVSFTWNTRDKAKVDVEDSGFIAQELLQVQEQTGIIIPNLVSQENPDKLEAGYGTLIPVLVSAMQELTAMVKQLQNEITTLKGEK